MMVHRQASVRPPVLLGRHDDCLAVSDLLDTVREGMSQVLVVIGEAGIGKSRLLEFAGATATGLQVARTLGTESEQKLGFAALHQLLHPYLDRLPRLPGPQRDALGSAFGLMSGPPADRFLVGLATLTLLAEVAADTPLLCVIDDAQWLDRESLEALTFVGRRLHAEGVGLLLSLRDGQRADSPVLEGLPQRRITGLPELAARELLSVAVGDRLDDRVAGRLVAETGGNPLALLAATEELTSEQLLGRSALPMSLPAGPRIEAHFVRQVRAMPMRTQTLLLVASVCSQDDPSVLRRAAAVLGLSLDDAEPALAEGILTLDHAVIFRHPLIRSAIYGSASGADRRRAHQTLAAVTDRERDPDRRAWHLAAAALGPDEEVASELQGAADRARARGGNAAVAALVSRAAELTPDVHDRAVRLLDAAQVYFVLGDQFAAQDLLEQAAPGLLGVALRAEGQRLKAILDMSFRRFGTATVILLEAAATLGEDHESLARDILVTALESALICRRSMVGTTAQQVGRAALERRSSPAPLGVRDLLIEAFATRMTQGHPAAVPRMQAVITALRTDSDLIEPGTPLAVLGCHAADELWEHSRRREMLERLEAHDRTHALFNALRMTLYGLAVCDLLAGQFQDADARYAEAAELTVAVGLPSMGTTMETELMAWRGQEVAARASAELMLQVWCHQLGVWSMAGFVYLSLLTLELSLGRYREALLIGIEAYQDDAPGLGNRILPDLVEAAVRAGDPRMAAVALARLTERAEASRTSWALGLLARCRALLAGDDQAEALYREALEHFASTALVTETARTHLLFGEWLRRRRRRGDARNELRIAHSLFEEMGAVLFADRARVELRATGEHARKRTQQTGHGLTPQQTQIAGLAARGATNTEIATRLFITASTVEYHLNKIFRKLDLTSRRQLSQTLRDQPPETVGG